MLTSKYWFLAVKRAVEVSNIMPTKHKETITMPYELVYHQKTDYCTLFPQFNIAYICRHHFDNKDIDSWVSKSLKYIAVGSCLKSDKLLFYLPLSKQLLTCGEGYCFDLFSPSGPQFGQYHENDFEFTTKSAQHNIHSTPTHESNATAYMISDNTYIQVRILDVLINEEDKPYTDQTVKTGDIHQLMHNELQGHDLSANPQIIHDTQKLLFPNLPLINHDSKETLYLHQVMSCPKQGFLHRDDNNNWTFIACRTIKGGTIPLPNFSLLVDSMVANKNHSRAR